ncbi:MAG: glycosyltransferase family 39 protein [Chloroflexia bacterium]
MDLRYVPSWSVPAAIGALGLGVRLYRLHWPGLWSDEGFAIFLARLRVPDLLIGTANDLHPPLFYLLLKGWLLPGWSVTYARLFSLLCGLLTGAVVYRMGRDTFSSAVGKWAALYFALCPMAAAYAREARMYALLLLFSALAFYLAWRWATSQSPGTWAGYVAAMLAALYTQNLALLLLAVVNVLVLMLLAQQRRWRALLPWIAAQLLVGVGYLPWLPIALYQTLYHRAAWIERARLGDLGVLLSHLAFGEPALHNASLWQWAAWIWLGGVVGLGGWLAGRGPRARLTLLFASLWFLLFLGTLFGLALCLPIYQEKQFLVLVAPLCLLAGVGTEALPRVPRGIAVAAFLLLIAPSLYNLYFVHRIADHPVEEQWQELAAFLDRELQPGDGLVIQPGAAATTLDLFLHTRPDRIAYPRAYDPHVGNFVGEVATPERVETLLRPFAAVHTRIWLIECCVPTFWDPGRHIPAWLETWGEPVSIPDFAGLEVRLFRAREH